jgi:hypothetical protein
VDDFRGLVRGLGSRRSVFCSLALVASVYLLTLGGMARSEFWIGDNAVKFLQVEALLASDHSDFSLPWPGRELDPDYRYNPLPAPFSRVQHGKLYPTFPPAFAAVSTLPYRWFGAAGLYLLPLLCSVLMLGGVAALAGETAPGTAIRHAAVLIAGLCTPVWFYAVEFWEHALALCGAIWATWFCWRFLSRGRGRDLASAGLLLAVATWFREESLLLAAVVMLFVLLEMPRGKPRALALFAASLAGGLVPLLIFQQWALGRALGIHVQNVLPSISSHLASRVDVFYRSFLAAGPRVGLSLLVSGPFLLCFLWRPRLSPAAFRVALPLAGLAVAAAAVVTRYSAASLPGRIAQLMSSNSLFPAAPVLALALMRCRESSEEVPSCRYLDWLHKIALGFALLFAMTAPEISSTGIHWGNRHLLVLYPLLAVLAAANLRAWLRSGAMGGSWLAAPLVLAVAISFAAQVDSIQLMRTKKEFSVQLRRELARHPERVIVTDVWWAPQELFSTFYDRPIFFVQTPVQMDDLAARLRRGGFDRLLFVSSAARRLPYPGVTTVSDGGLGYFSLSFLGLALPPAGSAGLRLEPTR